VRNLQALAQDSDYGDAKFTQVVSNTPMLKFNGSFLGELKDLSENAALGNPSSGLGGGEGGGSSGGVAAWRGLEKSTLGKILRHALRPARGSGGDRSSGGRSPAFAMTWEALIGRS